MPGESKLSVLLTNMSPRLHGDEFVFCSLGAEVLGGLDFQPLATFREDEAISVIVRRAEADAAGLDYEYVSRMIKLEVHSSLHAVGFIAAIAERLARAGISTNPVSAYFHDYLFVPADRADEALQVLLEMTTKPA